LYHTSTKKESTAQRLCHPSSSSTIWNHTNQASTHENKTMSSGGSNGSGNGGSGGSGRGSSGWNPILSHGSAIGILKPDVVFDVYGSSTSSGGSSSSSSSNRGGGGGGSSSSGSRGGR
ncbi:hypothetical protein PpBr36_02274, partial [Pyricularia pennisetigena]|uniref:hypothetical protein n=1 Tax=Pyricularia pennisetigena TaxID=1578925 RepID=UPI00114D90C4